MAKAQDAVNLWQPGPAPAPLKRGCSRRQNQARPTGVVPRARGTPRAPVADAADTAVETVADAVVAPADEVALAAWPRWTRWTYYRQFGDSLPYVEVNGPK